ncbi:MAG: hypothetical protein KJ731_09045, partial [Alphaproteobacteria bacterium]|nr:hypothetical protein [Alphaproteobacteria bacterium]
MGLSSRLNLGDRAWHWSARARKAQTGETQIRDARPTARFDFSGGLFCRSGGFLPHDPGQNASRVDPVP